MKNAKKSGSSGNIFQRIHHWLLRRPKSTKVWILLLDALAFLLSLDMADFVQNIKINGINDIYETITSIPYLVSFLQRYRLLVWVLCLAIVLALLIKKKMVVLTIRSRLSELEKADLSEYSPIYNIVYKEINLNEIIDEKCQSDSIIKSVQMVANICSSGVVRDRNTLICCYGNAHIPFLFKMGASLSDRVDDIKMFHKMSKATVFKEWAQSDSPFEIRLNYEIDPQDAENELVVYVETITKPNRRNLIDLSYHKRHVLVFSGNNNDEDSINSYADAMSASEFIYTNISGKIEKYGIKRIHMVLSSSSDFILFMGMKYRKYAGVDCIVYSSLLESVHPWGIIIDSDVNQCYCENRNENNRPMLGVGLPFYEYITKWENNVFLSKREVTDNKKSFPIEKKLAGINRITIMNLAGSTFIGNVAITNVYEQDRLYTDWFFDRLENGDLETTVILNDPHSFAALDAALSKMNLRDPELKKHSIIQSNINKLLIFKKKYSNARINLYLTEISLPYAVMLAENTLDQSMTYMKVDLYSPLGEWDDMKGFDDERPSFYLMRNNPSTFEVYKLFEDAVDRVKNNKRTKKYTAKNLNWLFEKPVIHRGRINHELPDHSVRGYFACIAAGYPFEVDLFFLKDGTIMAGRDEELFHKEEGTSCRLSELTLNDLRAMKTEEYWTAEHKEPRYMLEELMTLQELLDLINGKVGLLIELKVDAKASDKEYASTVSSVLSALRYYQGNFCICAANPKVLREAREQDQTVILGQISWSFDGADVTEEYRRCHTEMTFLDVVEPDFISYKIGEIGGNEKLLSLCAEKKLPLLAWTILDKKDQEMFLEINLEQKNMIIEGTTTYNNKIESNN